MGCGIFPPPDLRAFVVAAKDDIQIAVAVDVGHGSAGFGGEELGIDDRGIPAGGLASVKHERGRLFAEAQDEIVDAVAVEIGRDRAGLLRRSAGMGLEIASAARKVFPSWRRRGRIGREEHERGEPGECDDGEGADALIHRSRN